MIRWNDKEVEGKRGRRLESEIGEMRDGKRTGWGKRRKKRGGKGG